MLSPGPARWRWPPVEAWRDCEKLSLLSWGLLGPARDPHRTIFAFWDGNGDEKHKYRVSTPRQLDRVRPGMDPKVQLLLPHPHGHLETEWRVSVLFGFPERL